MNPMQHTLQRMAATPIPTLSGLHETGMQSRHL